jgi:hypothetical protein
MKKTIFLLLTFIGFSTAVFAQGQAETYINEALGLLKAKNYKQAQMSLQDAINEINNFIAQDVLNQLPTEINGLKAKTGDDNTNSAAMGMMGGGMTVSRKYATDDNKTTAEINIIANSPMLSSMSMFINNPAMMGSNPNQKSIRVGTRRAMLKKDIESRYDENEKSNEIQIYELTLVIGQTLVTIKSEGFANEQAFTAFYSKIDIEKIAKTLGEN